MVGTPQRYENPKETRIDRNLPVALYHQVTEVLRQEILNRSLEPGDFLATEERVEDRFGVSRATARHALQRLADEGLVVRITGKGTYVNKPKVQPELPGMFSFTEEIERLGMMPSSRIIEVSTVQPTDNIATHLELPEGELVLRLERVRYADGDPIVYMVDYLPRWLNLDPTIDLGGLGDSLYVLLESVGICISEAEHIIEAVLTDRITSEYLKVPIGSPVLGFERNTYDDRGRPIVYEESVCRADLYRYMVRLKRR